jgi:hypothetical protein
MPAADDDDILVGGSCRWMADGCSMIGEVDGYWQVIHQYSEMRKKVVTVVRR